MKRSSSTISIYLSIPGFYRVVRKVNVIIFKCEKKIGIIFTGFMLSIILFCCAGLYVKPNFSLFQFGKYYAKIAADPFHFDGDIRQFRILTPLIGYVLNLHGKAFIFVPLFISLLFLATLYIYFRRTKMQPISSLGITTMMAFSCPLLLIFYFQGYPDITSNLLILLSFIFIKKPYWILFYGLSFFNHESNFFIAPALLLLSIDKKNIRKDIWRGILLLIIAILPVLCFRYYVSHLNTASHFTNAYFGWDNIIYCIRNNLDTIHIGVFHSYKLFWILPLYCSIMLVSQKRFWECACIILFIIGPLTQTIAAVDINRLMEPAFPAFLLSMQYFYRHCFKPDFKVILWLLIIINIFVPEIIVISPFVIPRLILPIYVIQHFFYTHLLVH